MAFKESQRKLLSPSRAISGSENCNPNVISGSCKRKITKSSTAEQFLESNSAPKHLTSQACAEFNLISPPRKHVCSSKRCASKNPDYAVPATVNPKKFLASKRHILPPNGSTSCKCCIRKSKGEDGTADDQNDSMGACNRCSQDSQKRRWSSDDSVSRNLAGNGVPIQFPCTPSERNILEYPDSGHAKQASMNEAVCRPASETTHEECFTDTPKSWNDWPNMQTHHHSETVGKLNSLEDSTSPVASASSRGGCCGTESQAADLFGVEGPYCFGASCLNSTSEQSTLAAGDDSTSSPMPENEEATISPSPEKSGNWRLNAVLQAFGDLSPTREGRVKTLVRAFESLLSVTGRKGDEQARKPRCPLKFSYLSSNANLDGEKNVSAQREDFEDGGEEENEKEEVTDEEERVGQWQTNLWEEDVKDEEIEDRWQSPELVYSQSVVEGKENNEIGDQWLLEQECVVSREENVSNEREHGMENVSQKQEAQEDSTQTVADNKGKVGEKCQLIVVVSDEKQWQSHEAEQEYGHSLQKGVSEHKIEMRKQEQEISAQSVVEEDGEEDDKKKNLDEAQAEEGNGTDNREKQPLDIVSSQPLKRALIEADKDSALQELETKRVPASSLNPMMVAASKRQPWNQKIHSNLQQQLSQTFVDGEFSFKAARKQQSSRIRKSLRGSNCSISSTRPPLTRKSEVQSAQDKPHVSKPQPFKLLTEARGHIKEQEFLMKLRKILEEEEKLRVPLAQGLPWTTDEPEIPYKPPVKDSTKPLDIHLNSDIRAMERADFDRFIAEKLLYIEQRRMEEECVRKAAEEEEIKKMRQEMVPKAQLMPYFDRPFRPRRSSKRPTIPKEPQFKFNKQQSKRQKCVTNST